MKLFLIGIFALMVQSCLAQELKFSYYCNDVKIISDYTNDSIDRCALFKNNRDDVLKKLGNDYTFSIIEDMFGSMDRYLFGKDGFSFMRDTTTPYASFSIFSNKFKVLINNKYLVEVGDNIEEIFKEYKPIPIREDQGKKESAIHVEYLSKTKEENIIKGSLLAIIFDNKSKIITKITDYITQ